MEAVTSKQAVSSADENYFDVRNLGQIGAYDIVYLFIGYSV